MNKLKSADSLVLFGMTIMEFQGYYGASGCEQRNLAPDTDVDHEH